MGRFEAHPPCLTLLMRTRTISVLVALAVSALFYSACDTGLKGDLNENQPPSTFFTVNEINLPEDVRLVSQVNISWWGDDPDGYIVGYEFQIGDENEPWVFTTRSDSTFVLPIEEGNMDADVRFSVRAIDNDGAVDPNPPSLVFPIRNSPPEIGFVSNETPPDSTFRVFSFGWNASDPDGDANLNRIEVALNDSTEWQEIPVDITFLTVRIDDTVEPATSQVFLGRGLNSSGITFDSINLDGDNEFYIRAVDNAGAVSPTAVHEWYIKRQTSRILFLNDYFGSNSNAIAQLHLDILADLGFTQIDYMDISDGLATGGRRVPFSQAFPDRSLAQPTINLMLAEWDHIYWLSDNLDRHIGYGIEITTQFFDNGGTMFINIPTKNISPENPMFEFLPFERMEILPSGQQSFILANNSEIKPDDDFIDNPPFLAAGGNLISYYPIVPFGESVPLFEGDFRTRNPSFIGGTSDFDGSKLISATNPDENIVFFGIRFQDLSADSDLSRLVELTCIEILGFQQ